MPETVEQFAQRIKSKHPEYEDVPDVELTRRVLAKYPEYKASIGGADPSPKLEMKQEPETLVSEGAKQLTALGTGLKDLVNTKWPFGKLAHGVYEGVAAPARELTGNPQPGRSVLSAPTTPFERGTGAFSAALGGDPAAGRMHAMQGEHGAEFADYYTVPLVTAASFGVGKVLKAFLPGLSDEAAITGRANRLTRATGTTGKSVDMPLAYREAIPELDKTVKLTGKAPTNPTELQQLVQDTFTRTEGEFNQHLAPISNQQVMPGNLVSALRGLKKSHAKTAAAREWNAEVDRRIVEYSQPYSYGELNEERIAADDRLKAFYAANPSSKGAKLGASVNTAVDDVIKKEARQAIYDEMQRVNQGRVPAYYFSTLKRRQSALYDIKDALDGRINELSNQDALGIMERAKVRAHLSGHGLISAYAGSLGEAIYPESKATARAVRKGINPSHRNLTSLTPAVPIEGRRQLPSLAPEESEP